jgi:hypothetical protein
MKKSIIITAIGLQALIANAQISVSGANQQVFQFNTVTNSQGFFESMAGKTVTGRPLSATEERHSLQILGDGTRIERTDTDKFYRDDQGRTRSERQDGTILVNDPVQGMTAEINGNRKVVKRKASAISKGSVSAEVAARIDAELASAKTTSAEVAAKIDAELASVKATAVSGASTSSTVADKLKAEALAKSAARQEEDLGYQSVNGVTAQGFRTTTTIPAGQIGNDRPIQIVSERWYSADLQMNVKTINSDPRFGETTYQLTNILQVAPDPSLFQVPAGHAGDTAR